MKVKPLLWINSTKSAFSERNPYLDTRKLAFARASDALTQGG